MNGSFKTHMILIIKGLTLKDLNTIDEHITTNENKFSYNSIPSEFISVEEWPKYTNLLCWHCDRSVSSYPKFIPKNPYTVNGSDRCSTLGNFDTWECAAAYTKQMFSKDASSDILKNIIIFANRFEPIKAIIPAIEKTRMKSYCGNDGLTIEQYGELIQKNTYEICQFL